MTSEGPGPGAPAAPRGVRSELAEGDALTRYPPGAPLPLRFDSRLEWEGWKAREEGDEVRATFPGTPVRVDGEWYEVVRAERVGQRFAYYLAPWDESFPLRAPQELSAEACRREHARHRERARRQQATTGLWLLSPLVGLLPAAEQEQIERELGLPAVRTTLVSALFFLLPAMALAALGMAVIAIPGFAEHNPRLTWARTILPFSLLVLADALVRLVRGLAGEPAGSVPLVMCESVFRQLRSAMAGGAERSRLAPAGAFIGVRDEMRPLPPAGGEGAGYEVGSRLPKPHWTLHTTPIRYAGRHWVAVERQELGAGDERRHRFVLRPYPAEVMRAAPVDYVPEEVEALHRALVVNDRQMWVGIGGALFGALDPARQAALARVFDYDPLLQTRRNTTLGLVFGGTAAGLALLYVASGSPQLADFGMLATGIAVLSENALRRKRLARGIITGSVLGVLLRPVAWWLGRGLH